MITDTVKKKALISFFAAFALIVATVLIGRATTGSGLPTEEEIAEAYRAIYETCIPVEEWNAKEGELKRSDPAGWESWKSGKDKCDTWKETADDRFVSFRKTDGAEGGADEGDDYTMYGIITMYDAEEGKEEEHKVDVHFERRESGWAGLSVVAYQHRGEFLIER